MLNSKKVYITGQEIDSDLKPIYLGQSKSHPLWAKALIYLLYNLDKDFIILNDNETSTMNIKDCSDWQQKAIDLTINRSGIFVLWYEDIDELKYEISLNENYDYKNAIIIIGASKMDEEVKEKLEEEKDTFACYSFEEIYEIINKNI